MLKTQLCHKQASLYAIARSLVCNCCSKLSTCGCTWTPISCALACSHPIHLAARPLHAYSACKSPHEHRARSCHAHARQKLISQASICLAVHIPAVPLHQTAAGTGAER